jgi:RimJ/RimL family protein N-acetyltransferase
MHVYLETERLLLRRFTMDDVENLVELDSDPEVMRFITGGDPVPRATYQDDYVPWYLEQYQRYPGYGFWAAIEKESGDFIGWFHFRPQDDADLHNVELGYRLRRSDWGKGYGTEG